MSPHDSFLELVFNALTLYAITVCIFMPFTQNTNVWLNILGILEKQCIKWRF